MLRTLRGLALLLLVGATSWASAWGFDAHRLTAELAERQLTPEARSEVKKLLKLEHGSALASISTWADEARSSATAVWSSGVTSATHCTDARFVPWQPAIFASAR